MRWEFHTFDSLDKRALFTLIKLRVDVFVVEQACAYPELDAADCANTTIHLLGYQQNTLAAYARAMPGQTSIKIGRVVVAAEFRRQGLATTLMQKLLSQLEQTHSSIEQSLAAQVAVQEFYESLGFNPVSEPYLEDGIKHIDMLRMP